MKIGIGIPKQIIGFDAVVLRDYAVTAEALGFDFLTCVDPVLGTTHDRREPPFPPGRISTEERLDSPRVAPAVDSVGGQAGGRAAVGSSAAARRGHWVELRQVREPGGPTSRDGAAGRRSRSCYCGDSGESRSSTSNRVAPHRPGEHQPRLDRPVPIWFASRRMKASTCSYHRGREVLA